MSLLLFILLFVFTDLLFILNLKLNKKDGIFELVLLLISCIFLFLAKNNITLYLFVYLISNCINLVKNRKKVRDTLKKFDISKILLVCFIILNITIILELTVFNFRSYLSSNYHEIDITEFKTNMEYVEGSKYKIVKKNPYIKISSINKKVNNIYFDIKYEDSFCIYSYLTDEANLLYYRVDNRYVQKDVERSKILNLNTSGKSKKLKFNFSFEKDKIVEINKIIINYNIPINVNIIRMLIVFFVIMFIYFLNPKSNLYKIKYSDFKRKWIILTIIIMFSAGILGVFSINSLYNVDLSGGSIYTKMVDSLLKGKTYFKDDNNSEKLLNTMDNPYDTNAREKLFENADYYYLWDCAFYKGHYYCYFGVVPIVLFYLPFKLITVYNLQGPMIITLLSILCVVILTLLLHQIVKKYFKKCSVGLFVLLTLPLIFCFGLLYFLKMANIYAVPIISGLFFDILGLYFYVLCLKSKKMIPVKLFLGSLSFALVAGCRPQLLLGSLFIIPIVYLYLKDNKLEKKEIIKYGVCIAISYIVVALLLMYYNYIRFGSIFDFGANYNLTTNDMTKRGFSIGRIPLGIVMYFFNPVNMNNVFPYIIETELKTNYLGVTIYESMFGGVFFSTILTSINLLIFKLKKYLNSKVVFYTCLGCIISALTIVIADTEMAGILARYVTDYVWLLLISSILIILSLNENNLINKKVLIEIVFVLVVVSLGYQFFYSFAVKKSEFSSQ